MKDNNLPLALMTGIDISITECSLIMHQPTLKEIAYIGEETFFSAIQCLCLNKAMFVDNFEELDRFSNFSILMTLLLAPEGAGKKMQVQKVLKLIFPEYTVLFTPRSLVFNHKDSSITIDEGNFEILQSYIKEAFCLSPNSADTGVLNPGDALAKKIAQKMMNNRARIAKQKGHSSGGSSFAQYISVITVGIPSMSLQDTVNLTMFQLYDLIQRYGLYTSWDIDLRSRLAGAKPETRPDDWMKNIH